MNHINIYTAFRLYRSQIRYVFTCGSSSTCGNFIILIFDLALEGHRSPQNIINLARNPNWPWEKGWQGQIWPLRPFGSQNSLPVYSDTVYSDTLLSVTLLGIPKSYKAQPAHSARLVHLANQHSLDSLNQWIHWIH